MQLHSSAPSVTMPVITGCHLDELFTNPYPVEPEAQLASIVNKSFHFTLLLSLTAGLLSFSIRYVKYANIYI